MKETIGMIPEHRRVAGNEVGKLSAVFQLLNYSILTAAMLLTIGSAAHAVTLARDGQATADIVIGADSPRVTQFAAKELAKYLKKITGGQFQIVPAGDNAPEPVAELIDHNNAVLVGKSAYTGEFEREIDDIEPGGYAIISRPDVIAIFGNDDPRVSPKRPRGLGDAGSLYSVYRFLRKLGVRFYYPTEFGEVVPSTSDLDLERFRITDAPYFPMRLAQSPIAGDRAAVWMRKLGFGATRYLQASCHSFNHWARKYKEDHPEYFALHGDRRINHICFSHPAARKQMVRHARKWLNGHDADLYPYFTIMQNDGAPGPCRCELCKPHIHREQGWMGLQSDLVADAAVEVANTISEDYPNRGICIGAYNDYTRPPVEIQQIPDNVAVCIFKHRQLFWDPEGKAGFHDVLNGWLELGAREISFWEYYNFDCWGGGRWAGVPAVTTKLIADDIKYLKQKSEQTGVPFAGELIFCDGRLKEHWQDRLWWMGLNYYMTAKCLWNPDISRRQILDEFYSRFFGPAAEPMRRFYSLAEKTWNTGEFGGEYTYGDKKIKSLKDRVETGFFRSDPWKHLFTPDTLNKMNEHLKNAEEKVSDSPYTHRVQMVRDGFDWTLKKAQADG